MRTWYCILPRHFGVITDGKAEKCLEKECIHLCYEEEREAMATPPPPPAGGSTYHPGTFPA